MHYYLYATDAGRFVAIGEDYFLRNVHRVTPAGLQQTSEWVAGRPADVTVDDSMHGSWSDIEDRFGAITPLPINALMDSVRNRDALADEARRLAREAAIRRMSEPINFVKVPDEVLAVDQMTNEQLREASEEAKARRAKLPQDQVERYDRFLKRSTDRYGSTITLRQYVREALMSFARVEHALEMIAQREAREAEGG